MLTQIVSKMKRLKVSRAQRILLLTCCCILSALPVTHTSAQIRRQFQPHRQQRPQPWERNQPPPPPPPPQQQQQQHHHQQLVPRFPQLSWDYHNYTSMTTFLRHVSTVYSNLTALYSIGQSVQGRELWVMVVSRSPYEHMVGKPNVKYVANMHGNEAVGRELMLHFILHLVLNYETDYYVRWLLDNTRIHIMPSMNPDGFEVATEGTCQGGQGRSVSSCDFTLVIIIRPYTYHNFRVPSIDVFN